MTAATMTLPGNALFDTLAYAKRLITGGFTEQQAEVQAQALAEIVATRLATNADMERLRHEMKTLRIEVQRDLKALEERLSYQLTVRLGGMLTAAVVVVAALVKLL